MKRNLAILIALGMLAACRKPAAERKPIVVATSADIAATGLPEQLVRRFASESQVDAGVIAQSDDQLVAAARSGKIDVAIINSPELLTAFRNAGLVNLATLFAYDDYIVAGPRKDPARIRGSKTAAEAFRKIVKRRDRFCSPVDVKALHDREEVIWGIAHLDPKTHGRYAPCHGTAAAALDEAIRLGAYTMTDRATMESTKTGGYASLLEGTTMLHNDYTVVLLTPPAKNRNAEWFVQWLMSYRGREVVEGYRFDGERRFFLAEQR